MANNDELRKVASDFFEEIWNQKLEASIDKFIATDAAGNDPKFGVGRESFRTQWREWIKAFPDLHFEVKEIIVEGNRVVTHWFLTGTHTGAEFQGFSISGNRVGVDGISIDTIEGGMVTEGFDSWDQFQFRQQLGGGSTLGT